jgi:protein-disulfide isomerase
MNNLKKYLPTVVIIVLIVVASYFLLTKSSKISQRTNSKIQEIAIGNLPPLGNPQAPVKIIEFGDFLCPFCGQAVLNLYPQLEPLIQQGKIVVYFRDFVVHPEATIIHNASRCANEQNKYWEFHKSVFIKFMNGEATSKKENLLKLAQELNLDKDSFEKCLSENRYNQDIQNDTQYGFNVGVQGTPTFFINGQKVEGINIPQIQSILNQLVK